MTTEFAIAKYPTPILNVADFKAIFGGSDGASLPVDEQGLLREIEMVALPGTLFTIQEACSELIYRIQCKEYPGDKLFVDKRFLIPSKDFFIKDKTLPSKASILEKLSYSLGLPYIWGGNWSQGVPQLLQFYPPQKKLDEKTRALWSLKGLDCSGLLYEATEGLTPRNTSGLVSFGTSLPIAGKSAHEIKSLAKPLDMIVWKGHVVLVFDEQTAIESRAGFGVVQTSLLSRLVEIMQERTPANSWTSSDGTKSFVLNRWHPEA